MNAGLELDDAIVLLLGAPASNERLSGQLSGITRLEKLIFLLERETNSKSWLTEDARFVAYNYGPFSSKIYQAVDALSAADLISDSGSLSNNKDDTWESAKVIGATEEQNRYTTREFTLTERGHRYFKALVRELSPAALEELSAFKTRFGRAPLKDLVRYVYQRYGEYTSKSLIREEILGAS